MEDTIRQVLRAIKNAFGVSVFSDPVQFKAALKDVRIGTDAKPIRNLLNIAVCDMQSYSRLELAKSSNNSFIIDNLVSEMSSDYRIDKRDTQIIIGCLAELLGTKPLPSFSKLEIPIVRIVLKILFMIDVSGSMAGNKIATVNRAMRELIVLLKGYEDDFYYDTRIYVLTFGINAEWIIRDIDIHDFAWHDLSTDPGTGDYTTTGAAFGLIMDEPTLERDEFILPRSVIVLITDGCATDNYDEQLKNLLGSEFGRRSRRISIAVGDDCDIEKLKRFGTHHGMKSVFSAHKTSDLSDLINCIHFWYSESICAQPYDHSDYSNVFVHDAQPDPNFVIVDIGDQDDEW